MTRNPRVLPDEELERLSAYLDGRLPREEATHLEARLEADKDLGRALDELRHTVRLLHSLPQLKVPRNFTLSPQMAGKVTRRWVYPVLQLGTAVATLAFLVVAGFGLLLIGGGMASAPAMTLARDLAQEAAAPPAEQPMMEFADQAALPTQAPAPEEVPPPGALFAGAAPSALAETAAAGVATPAPACAECVGRASSEATPLPLEEGSQPTTQAAGEPCPCAVNVPEGTATAELFGGQELKAAAAAETPTITVAFHGEAERRLMSPFASWALLVAVLGIAAATLAILTLRMRRRNR